MRRKIAIPAIAFLTITLVGVIVAGNIIPRALAQATPPKDALEKLAQSASTNATGNEKTFVGIISCNTAHPDFSKPLEDKCDFTVLVPAP
jgi:hypothetical protein